MRASFTALMILFVFYDFDENKHCKNEQKKSYKEIQKNIVDADATPPKVRWAHEIGRVKG